MIINSCPLVGQDSFFSPHSSVCSYLYNELILRPMPPSVLKSKLSECFKNILILFFAVTKEKKPKKLGKEVCCDHPNLQTGENMLRRELTLFGGTGCFFGCSSKVPGLWRTFSHQCPSQRHIPPSFYILSPTQVFCLCQFLKKRSLFTLPMLQK